jgi:hypothetical protein
MLLWASDALNQKANYSSQKTSTTAKNKTTTAAKKQLQQPNALIYRT